MNERLLKMKISSIEHYEEEIKKTKEVLSELGSVRSDLIENLKNFCPFEKGDIICRGDFICVFDSVKSAWHTETGFGLTIGIFYADSHNLGRMTERDEKYYRFENPYEWTVLRHAKKEVSDEI